MNFTVPISALVRRIERRDADGQFELLDLDRRRGDVPTVFAGSVSGLAGTLIQINPTGAELGASRRIRTVALGRSQSERIYYIVSGMNSNAGVQMAFTNASGQIVGLDNGDGSWLLEPTDLADLRIITTGGSSGTVNMTLTTVAVENDSGSRATSATSAAFSVTVTANPGGSGPPPLARSSPSTSPPPWRTA